MLDYETQEIDVLVHQDKLIASGARNVAMPAGYRAGKSRGLVLWAIHRAYECAIPGAVLSGMLVEPTYKMVERILVRDLQEVLDELEIPYTHWKQQRVFRLHFGETNFDIYLASADRPDTLVGTTLCFVGLDEAGLMDEEAFKRSMPRVSEPRAEGKLQFLACGTPEGFGPYYNFAEGKPPSGFERINARTWDNPYLPGGPAAYIEEALGYLTEQEKLQYVDGLFIAKGGRVYDFYVPGHEGHELPCLAPFEGELVMGCDFGIATSVFALCSVFSSLERARDPLARPHIREVLHVWGEVVGRRKSTLTQVEVAKRAWLDAYVTRTGQSVEWGPLAERIKAYADAAPNARADREILFDRGFDVIPSSRNETINDRVYSMNAKMKKREFFVDPDGAPYTAKAFRQQGWDKYQRPEKPFDDGTGEPGPDHFADAVGNIVIHRWPLLAPRGNSEVHHHH